MLESDFLAREKSCEEWPVRSDKNEKRVWHSKKKKLKERL